MAFEGSLSLVLAGTFRKDWMLLVLEVKVALYQSHHSVFEGASCSQSEGLTLVRISSHSQCFHMCCSHQAIFGRSALSHSSR